MGSINLDRSNVPAMFFLMTRNTKGYPIRYVKSQFWKLAPRLDMVWMQFATICTALLASIVIAFKNGLAPLVSQSASAKVCLSVYSTFPAWIVLTEKGMSYLTKFFFESNSLSRLPKRFSLGLSFGFVFRFCATLSNSFSQVWILHSLFGGARTATHCTRHDRCTAIRTNASSFYFHVTPKWSTPHPGGSCV